eukprot:14495760-Alexandrium_andersonii.AAC.1
MRSQPAVSCCKSDRCANSSAFLKQPFGGGERLESMSADVQPFLRPTGSGGARRIKSAGQEFMQGLQH